MHPREGGERSGEGGEWKEHKERETGIVKRARKQGGREENRGIGTEERMHREMYVRRKRTWSRYYSSTSFTCVP